MIQSLCLCISLRCSYEWGWWWYQAASNPCVVVGWGLMECFGFIRWTPSFPNVSITGPQHLQRAHLPPLLCDCTWVVFSLDPDPMTCLLSKTREVFDGSPFGLTSDSQLIKQHLIAFKCLFFSELQTDVPGTFSKCSFMVSEKKICHIFVTKK